MFRAIDTATGQSIMGGETWRNTDECLMYVEGAFLKPQAIVEKLQALAVLTRQAIVGLIPAYTTPQGRRYWAKVNMSAVDRTKRVQTNLSQLEDSARCIADYVHLLRPQAVVGYSQGANVVLRAQMIDPQAFPPVVAICPGVIEGLMYEKIGNVSLIGASDDQFIDESLRHMLADMLGVHEHVLHGHTHDWSETMLRAAVETVTHTTTR